MSQLAPQRLNMSELAYGTHYDATEYWPSSIEHLKNLDTDTIATRALSRVSTVFKENQEIVLRGKPDRLYEHSDLTVRRRRAKEAYNATGPLNSAPKSDFFLPLLPALFKEEDVVSDSEWFQDYVGDKAQNQIAKRAINLSASSITLRDITTSILMETATESLSSPNSQSRELGIRALKLAQFGSRNIPAEAMHQNIRASTSLLQRDFDLRFYRLHRLARAGGNINWINSRFLDSQIQYIDKYLEWENRQGVGDVGISFEWQTPLFYRNYLWRHGMLADAYIQNGHPFQERPSDQGVKVGFPRQSFDFVVKGGDRPYFIQCKIGIDMVDLVLPNGRVIGVPVDLTDYDYVDPIKIVKASEASDEYQPIIEVKDKYQVKKIMSEYESGRLKINRFSLQIQAFLASEFKAHAIGLRDAYLSLKQSTDTVTADYEEYFIDQGIAAA